MLLVHRSSLYLGGKWLHFHPGNSFLFFYLFVKNCLETMDCYKEIIIYLLRKSKTPSPHSIPHLLYRGREVNHHHISAATTGELSLCFARTKVVLPACSILIKSAGCTCNSNTAEQELHPADHCLRMSLNRSNIPQITLLALGTAVSTL